MTAFPRLGRIADRLLDHHRRQPADRQPDGLDVYPRVTEQTARYYPNTRLFRRPGDKSPDLPGVLSQR